jgi:hypothetical protein
LTDIEDTFVRQIFVGLQLTVSSAKAAMRSHGSLTRPEVQRTVARLLKALAPPKTPKRSGQDPDHESSDGDLFGPTSGSPADTK